MKKRKEGEKKNQTQQHTHTVLLSSSLIAGDEGGFLPVSGAKSRLTLADADCRSWGGELGLGLGRDWTGWRAPF